MTNYTLTDNNQPAAMTKRQIHCLIIGVCMLVGFLGDLIAGLMDQPQMSTVFHAVLVVPVTFIASLSLWKFRWFGRGLFAPDFVTEHKLKAKHGRGLAWYHCIFMACIYAWAKSETKSGPHADALGWITWFDAMAFGIVIMLNMFVIARRGYGWFYRTYEGVAVPEPLPAAALPAEGGVA